MKALLVDFFYNWLAAYLKFDMQKYLYTIM